MMKKRIVVAVTGASGAPYARRLLECLVRESVEVHLVVSPYGRRLFADENVHRRPNRRSPGRFWNNKGPYHHPSIPRCR
ncbi:MAG: hypothetical protein IPK83_14500 [Planctomycetes bacterium]|nr:hypothetical protein [Planctomycetota bacterium]